MQSPPVFVCRTQLMNRLVVLSGGQDSTTCLYMARARCEEEGGAVCAVTFNYGQRHERELDAARTIARMAGAQQTIINLPHNTLVGTSPLVNRDVEVEHYSGVEALPGGVEKTFVPFRNLLFLTIAANHAVARDCGELWIGVSQEDYGGYPDCREHFLKQAERALYAACPSHPLRIVAPLLFLSKRDTVLEAQRLSGCMDALAYSHTCYDGAYPPNPHNHASLLRARGFKDAGVADPLIMRAKAEGLLPASYPDHGLVEVQQ